MPSTIRKVVKKLPFARKVYFAFKTQGAKAKIRRLLAERLEISIEVGSGSKKGKGEWITIDLNEESDLQWNLVKGIPFPDQSINKIYSSHFFEHLSYKETQLFLDECKRVLKPNGKFLICVPNARLYLMAYASGEVLDPNTFFGHEPAYNHTTRMDYVNYTAYMDGEHKYMFDEENLIHILNAKGLRNAHLRPFDPELDMIERDFESIYAEAEK